MYIFKFLTLNEVPEEDYMRLFTQTAEATYQKENRVKGYKRQYLFKDIPDDDSITSLTKEQIINAYVNAYSNLETDMKISWTYDNDYLIGSAIIVPAVHPDLDGKYFDENCVAFSRDASGTKSWIIDPDYHLDKKNFYLSHGYKGHVSGVYVDDTSSHLGEATLKWWDDPSFVNTRTGNNRVAEIYKGRPVELHNGSSFLKLLKLDYAI